MGNNPVNGTDPTGELFVIDDLILAAVGGAINLGVNLYQGNIKGNFLEVLGQGAAAFGAGAAAGALATYGPAGWAAGGAILGATNGWLSGARGWDIATSAGIGAVSGLAGGYIGQGLAPGISKLTNDIASPALRGLVGGSIGGSVTGGTLGGINSAIQGDGFWSGFGTGALQGGLTGGIAGGASAAASARANGYNPWNGQKINPFTLNRLQSMGPSVDGSDLPSKLPKVGASTSEGGVRPNSVSIKGGDFTGKAINNVRFGNDANQEYHAFRHIESAGMSKTTVASAIRSDVNFNNNIIKPGIPHNATVLVQGISVTYTAFKLPDGTINIGRITLPR